MPKAIMESMSVEESGSVIDREKKVLGEATNGMDLMAERDSYYD